MLFRKKLPTTTVLLALLVLAAPSAAQPPPCTNTSPGLEPAGSRYLEVSMGECTGDFAIRIFGQGRVGCVALYVQPDGRLGPLPYLQSAQQWGTSVFVSGAEIVPAATYTARLEALNGTASNLSFPALTWPFGESDRDVSVLDTDDLRCVIGGVSGELDPPCTLSGADLGDGCCGAPDRLVDNGDGTTVQAALRGEEFPCPEPCCLVIEHFEGTAHGWTNSSSSTCNTGDFVLGTPSEWIADTIITQVGGDHSDRERTGKALFTAFNTEIGVDDVDGGECILESPEYILFFDSEISVWYFHGQRDGGDDPTGDYFRLEISSDGGETWTLMTKEADGTEAAFGDAPNSAVWEKAVAAASVGSRVRLRLRVSDGAGNGDIIEAGLDDLVICPVDP